MNTHANCSRANDYIKDQLGVGTWSTEEFLDAVGGPQTNPIVSFSMSKFNRVVLGVNVPSISGCNISVIYSGKDEDDIIEFPSPSGLNRADARRFASVLNNVQSFSLEYKPILRNLQHDMLINAQYYVTADNLFCIKTRIELLSSFEAAKYIALVGPDVQNRTVSLAFKDCPQVTGDNTRTRVAIESGFFFMNDILKVCSAISNNEF